MSTQVDLVSVKPSKKSELNRVCPEHTVKLNQTYHCPGTKDAKAHPVAWGTWNMGAPTEDGYRVVPQDTKPTVEGVGGLKLVPVPREQLENATFEGEGVYYAQPSNEHQYQAWGALSSIADSDVALVAKGALRKGSREPLWRVSTFNGYLVLREIHFPENINPPPAERGEQADDEMMELVSKFVEGLVVDWGDFDSSDSMAARIEAWAAGGNDVVTETQEDAPVIDLKAQLASLLES